MAVIRLSARQIQVEIREANASDFAFVTSLIESALSPYYGGDHRAHAERIFRTHLSGGTDNLGHFSLEQRMFIALVDNERAGLVHVVGKRQGTYKISPLIVAPGYRGRLGLGSSLLDHAEAYAADKGARQIYCTVSEENTGALQFFRRHRYTVAGRSASHYKLDRTEVMLYRRVAPSGADEQFDRPNISVLPMEEAHEVQVRALLLSALPKWFGGIDEGWVDALFRGYSRRESLDVNVKFKLIFVAMDRNGCVLGVAGATPKKGEPIKIMPLVAPTLPAFVALLSDVPSQLLPFGRKCYIHVSPSVEETVALQHGGWKLDAAMPGAYKDDVITQQWSLYIAGEGFMRTMRVKAPFLKLIREGTKTLEVRVAYDSIKTIQPGERIRFASRDDDQVVRVNDVRRYPTFASMLSTEVAHRIVPGRSESDILELLRSIYPADREALGVVVLDLAPEAE